MAGVQASTSPQDLYAHLGTAAAPVRIDVCRPPTFAISLGLSGNFPNDHAMLANGMAIYDRALRVVSQPAGGDARLARGSGGADAVARHDGRLGGDQTGQSSASRR